MAKSFIVSVLRFFGVLNWKLIFVSGFSEAKTGACFLSPIFWKYKSVPDFALQFFGVLNWELIFISGFSEAKTGACFSSPVFRKYKSGPDFAFRFSEETNCRLF
ncbi:hypothetical protein FH5T_17825 [Draconibacterium orientale]|mgnify:CR=1 FL=1|uniref:Uncharacterized protein n=1 Tax=Draconibacterium orientale TaxID=1168034 RepID=A0ABN4D404_9BACT|nr:hypothetical protein FH5T_17825 [Draconibacterium orientale]